MKSLAGHLLIAPQHERDLDFIRTVILLIQHSEEQALGVVLNRPTTTTVRQVWRYDPSNRHSWSIRIQLRHSSSPSGTDRGFVLTPGT